MKAISRFVCFRKIEWWSKGCKGCKRFLFPSLLSLSLSLSNFHWDFNLNPDRGCQTEFDVRSGLLSMRYLNTFAAKARSSFFALRIKQRRLFCEIRRTAKLAARLVGRWKWNSRVKYALQPTGIQWLDIHLDLQLERRRLSTDEKAYRTIFDRRKEAVRESSDDSSLKHQHSMINFVC